MQCMINCIYAEVYDSVRLAAALWGGGGGIRAGGGHLRQVTF
jgi:hypothetical protein